MRKEGWFTIAIAACRPHGNDSGCAEKTLFFLRLYNVAEHQFTRNTCKFSIKDKNKKNIGLNNIDVEGISN